MVALVTFSGLVTVCTAAPSFVKPKSYTSPEGNYSTEIILSAETVSIDPAARTITMDWFPQLYTPYVNCSAVVHAPVIREVYMARELMDQSSPTWRQEDPPLPIFIFNTDDFCPTYTWPGAVSVRTVTKLFPTSGKPYDGFLSASLTAYPEERYEAPFQFYVRNPDSGRLRALTVYNLTSSTLGFDISISTILVAGPRSEDQKLQFTMHITRSVSVKLFVYSAVVMSWLVTLAFLTIIAAAGVYSSHTIYAEMFVVPIGALFAFASIRANLPGAPDGFGTILDTFSIIPVLIIMSLSSFILLVAVLYKRIKYDPSPPLSSAIGTLLHLRHSTCPYGCEGDTAISSINGVVIDTPNAFHVDDAASKLNGKQTTGSSVPSSDTHLGPVEWASSYHGATSSSCRLSESDSI
ncbi:hypothetical protein CC2G_008071 [Coprinopsis cinerea AmutBmut pab1-1]|nr:hypothetical protein CC2G_008071 [Coprinopsis cinerea AmutBmut pab1-1]